MAPVYVWNMKEIADMHYALGDIQNSDKSMHLWFELVN